jgi:hypothetical protein
MTPFALERPLSGGRICLYSFQTLQRSRDGSLDIRIGMRC